MGVSCACGMVWEGSLGVLLAAPEWAVKLVVLCRPVFGLSVVLFTRVDSLQAANVFALMLWFFMRSCLDISLQRGFNFARQNYVTAVRTGCTDGADAQLQHVASASETLTQQPHTTALATAATQQPVLSLCHTSSASCCLHPGRAGALTMTCSPAAARAPGCWSCWCQRCSH